MKPEVVIDTPAAWAKVEFFWGDERGRRDWLKGLVTTNPTPDK
jgi:hypothetical protein